MLQNHNNLIEFVFFIRRWFLSVVRFCRSGNSHKVHECMSCLFDRLKVLCHFIVMIMTTSIPLVKCFTSEPIWRFRVLDFEISDTIFKVEYLVDRPTWRVSTTTAVILERNCCAVTSRILRSNALSDEPRYCAEHLINRRANHRLSQNGCKMTAMSWNVTDENIRIVPDVCENLQDYKSCMGRSHWFCEDGRVFDEKFTLTQIFNTLDIQRTYM